MKNNITEIDLQNDMLVASLLKPIDYSDCFITSIDIKRFKDIDTFVKNYFLSQPKWLKAVSFNMLTKKSLKANLEKNQFNPNDKVGSWRIYVRDKNEIVFGEYMGFMEYRFGMRIDGNKLRVATVVQYKGLLGRYYFLVVRVLHKKFVLMSLRYGLKEWQ